MTMFINIFDIIFDSFKKFIQIYIPTISIPNDNILKKKKDAISFNIISLLSDFELKTNSLVVIKANSTDKNQEIKTFR